MYIVKWQLADGTQQQSIPLSFPVAFGWAIQTRKSIKNVWIVSKGSEELIADFRSFG